MTNNAISWPHNTSLKYEYRLQIENKFYAKRNYYSLNS